MKVKVIKKFKDKNTHDIHEVGELLTISKDRYNEILAVGDFVEEIVEKKKKTAK